jgi:hypothetical protein
MKGIANIFTIALLSVIMVCLLAVPAMAQEEIVWQHGAVIPWDAERLTNNNMLITEYGNHTVIEVNPTTNEIVWQYGTGIAGSGPDQLNSPVDAERLPSGNTLITDRNNHRVIEVNTTGAIIWQYGTTGTSGLGYNQLNNPMDAERLPSGNTLIADRLNNRVIEVNESKEIVWQYGIVNPFDADRLPDGNTLIVEYTNHRVIEINTSDVIVWQYGDGTSGSGVNQLWNPMDADRLANGNTLIADYVNDRVIEVRTADYDPAKTDNGFTAASIVWEYGSNHPADADRLSSGSTLISEAGNNRVIEVGVVPAYTSWHDTFDDETKIAEKQYIIVENGDVAIDLDNAQWGWQRSSSLVSGLPGGRNLNFNPATAFNITGDGTWNLIYGIGYSGSGLYGYYWDGSQWISNPSLVAGVGGVGSYCAPALAFNITGDEKWNLISGESGGIFHGFYWNGSQWISDSSLVAGLGDIGGYSTPTMAFNITGDERWNLISGESGGIFHGFYWNGSQWVDDSSLISGLGDIGYNSAPAIAFNITADGKWGLISGQSTPWGSPYGFYGFYWNGSQWISDSSLVSGLSGKFWCKPDIAFNITGDGKWNLIYGYGGYGSGFYGYELSKQESVKSVLVQPSLSYFKNWAVFNVTETVPIGTSITYKILDASNNTIMSVIPGQDISSITETSIRLYAELTTISSLTPVLHDWGVCWETGEVDILPTAIETPTPLYTNVDVISAVIANDGEAHSGRFDVSLYANSTEVDKTRIENIPPGDNTSVTFFGWTPPHSGNHSLRIIVDSDNEIVESNEINNELTKEVSVLPTMSKRLTFDPHSSSVNPDIAADSKGNLHLVWSNDRDGWDGSYELYYKKLAPNGTVLVNDIRLTQWMGYTYSLPCDPYTPCPIQPSALNPAIAIDSDDNVHIVWTNQLRGYRYYDLVSTGANGRYMKLDNNGNIVTEPKAIELLPPNKEHGDYATWEGYSGIGGIAVDHEGNVNTFAIGTAYVGQPGASVSRTYRIYLIYVKLDNEGNELVNNSVVDTFTYTVKYRGCMEASDIAVDSDGNVYMVYTRGTCGCMGSGCEDYPCIGLACREAYYAKIDSTGVHLQELTGDLPLPSLYPSVCVDSGDNKHVIWSQHNGSGSYDFYYTKFDTFDTKVIDGKRITYENHSGAVSPIIDTESGAIHAAWSQESNIHYMGLDTSGGTLINRTLISLEDGSSWEPGVDAVKDGSHLVWTDNRDGNNEIYYAKTVPPPNRVFILAPANQWTPQNIVATYTVGILSTMSTTETFDLTWDNPDRADVAELSNSTITIEANSIGEVTLNVTDSRLGDYLVTVTVTSQTNPEIQDSATITTSVIVPTSDLIITAMDAYHNDTGYSPLFNLSNEVDVTVKNIGTKDVGAFDVELYADTTLVDTQSVADLGYGSSTTVQFKWTPIGADCEDAGSPQTYTLKAVADCSDVIAESDETNNELTAEETAYWAGYSADEHINAVAWHGVLRGGLNYTTGDGRYTGLYSPGSSVDTHYSITLPASASVELARLNVYYTWSKDYSTGAYPVMEVSITNTSGTYVVPINASYDDRPCDTPAIGYDYPFGNHVFDLTPYITGDGSYTVTVENVGTTGHSFCIAAPGVVILYKDSSKPEREFWILEGADLLEGGRRGGAGNLALSECISNATFAGSIDTDRVETATLGIVSAWGGSAWGADLTSYYWFNDNYLGDGSILGGYSSAYDRTVNCMSMRVANAQLGVNISDVTGYITGRDNIVSFGDDGDSMMAANAFLIVEYDEPCRGVKPEPAVLVPFMISGLVTNYSDGTSINNPGVTIKNLNTGEPLPVETRNGSNYYQGLTSLEKVSCGDVLQFTCDGTKLKHTVGQREVDAGGFDLDIAVGMMPEAIEAGVTFSPKKLDLNSSGVLKAYITLPEGYDVANISVSTVECEGAPVFGFGKVIPGKQALEVKFKIHNLTVPTGDAVLLTVTGELDDGTPFEASNTLKVV